MPGPIEAGSSGINTTTFLLRKNTLSASTMKRTSHCVPAMLRRLRAARLSEPSALRAAPASAQGTSAGRHRKCCPRSSGRHLSCHRAIHRKRASFAIGRNDRADGRSVGAHGHSAPIRDWLDDQQTYRRDLLRDVRASTGRAHRAWIHAHRPCPDDRANPWHLCRNRERRPG